MKTTNQIVGTGLIALDVLLKNQHTALYTALGGSTGNVLAILAYLKWESFPVAHIGVDTAGNSIRKEFKSLGADTRFLINETDKGTPIIYQWPGDKEKSHRFSFACPLCGAKKSFSDYSCDHQLFDEVVSFASSPQVFYFDRVTPLALRLAEIYRFSGAIIMFEPSEIPSDNELMRNALSLTHIIKYADDRISDLANFDLSNVQVEIQTLGAEGLRFRAPSLTLGWVDLPAIKVPFIADTAGSGDWCSSGFLHHLFSNNTAANIFNHNAIHDALRFGQALSALNCMYDGARGVMLYRSPTYIIRVAEALNKESGFNFKLTRTKSEQSRMHFYFKEVVTQKFKSNKFLRKPKLCCEPLEFMHSTAD
jgi:fructokinase